MRASDWRLLALHDYHLQVLVHGHDHEAVRWVNDDNGPPALRDWLAWQLLLPLTPAQRETLPIAHHKAWLGWRHYYSGHFPAAAECLHDACLNLDDSPESQHLLCTAALGLGKVYTRRSPCVHQRFLPLIASWKRATGQAAQLPGYRVNAQ